MDLSNYSDSELEAMMGETSDLSGYSDDELMGMISDDAPVEQATANPINSQEGGLRSSVQGATLGFGDEITAGVGAIPQALMTGQSIPEAYGQILQGERQRIGEFKEQSPWISGLSEVGGAIGSGVVAAPAMGIKALTQGGRLATGLKAAGIGGISGGAYAFGAGEGGAEERLEEIPTGSALGAFGGLAGLGIAKAVRPLTDRAKSLFSKQPVPKADDVMAESLPISGKPQTESVSELVQKGQTTDMLLGARNQDVGLMRQEEMARQGLLGDELELAVRGADSAFKQSVKDTAQSLAGSGTSETSEDTLSKSMNLVKKRFDAQKILQGKLMTQRNNAIAKASVYKDYTKETLGGALKELQDTADMKINLMRADNKPVLDDLKIAEKIMNGGKDGAIDMSSLGAWRSGLNSYQRGTQQSVLAGKAGRVYDDWLDSHLKMALKEGDEDLADKIFTANSRYAEFKTKYGTDKHKGQKNVIERILREEEMSPRAMVNAVFGKSMDGKDYTSQYVKRMINSMPEGKQRETVVEGFRAGLMQKSFEDSFDEVTDTINLGKFKNNLLKMKKNDSFRDYLTTPEHSKVIDDLIVDLNKYQKSTSDRSIVNVSGTAPMAARIMQSIGAIPIIRNVSLARGTAEGLASVAKSGTQAKNKRAVEKSVTDFYKTIAPELENIKMDFRTPAFSGGAIGSRTTEENN